MALRLVSSNKKKIELGEGDWIEVHEDISRRDFNKLISTLPMTRDGLNTDEIDLTTATDFAQALFEVFVTDWSVTDERGKKVPANQENYQMLSRESAVAIDNAVSEHFNSLTLGPEDAQKSEEPSV